MGIPRVEMFSLQPSNSYSLPSNPGFSVLNSPPSEPGVQSPASSISPWASAPAPPRDPPILGAHFTSPPSDPRTEIRLCLHEGFAFIRLLFLPHRPLRARVGDDHLLLFQKEQLRSTSSPVFHPKYQPCSGPILPHRSDEHDLMMLKLSSPVRLTSSVHPVQLPFRCSQPGSQCQVSGWGTTSSRRGKNWAGRVYFRKEDWTRV